MMAVRLTVLVTALLDRAPPPVPWLLASVTCQESVRLAALAVGSWLVLEYVTERRAAW